MIRLALVGPIRPKDWPLKVTSIPAGFPATTTKRSRAWKLRSFLSDDSGSMVSAITCFPST